MLSFAVVAARPGHEIPSWAHELLGRPALDELPRRRRTRPRAEGSMREEQRQAAFGSDLAGLTELVDLGAGHPLFDIVDRRALERALRRADPAFASRRALYDVATAAIWLDRAECEVAGLSRR